MTLIKAADKATHFLKHGRRGPVKKIARQRYVICFGPSGHFEIDVGIPVKLSQNTGQAVVQLLFGGGPVQRVKPGAAHKFFRNGIHPPSI